MKVTSQMWSAVCFTPTVCPANTWLRLILRPLIADAAAAGHDGGPVVKRIVQLLEAAIGARRAACSSSAGVCHVERLMRPFAG